MSVFIGTFFSAIIPCGPLNLNDRNVNYHGLFLDLNNLHTGLTSVQPGGDVMSETLFKELKNIGIDEELATKVSASLDPDYNASKKDVLVMQEAIMQVQVRSDARYHELNNKTERSYHELNNKIESFRSELRTEMHQGFAGMRTEMASMNRQYLVTFGGLISTIVAVFLVNLYFHI